MIIKIYDNLRIDEPADSIDCITIVGCFSVPVPLSAFKVGRWLEL